MTVESDCRRLLKCIERVRKSHAEALKNIRTPVEAAIHLSCIPFDLDELERFFSRVLEDS